MNMDSKNNEEKVKSRLKDYLFLIISGILGIICSIIFYFLEEDLDFIQIIIILILQGIMAFIALKGKTKEEFNVKWYEWSVFFYIMNLLLLFGIEYSNLNNSLFQFSFTIIIYFSIRIMLSFFIINVVKMNNKEISVKN